MKINARRVCTAVLTALGCVGVSALLAQNPIMSQPADSTFVLEAASGGMAEVKLGQLAQAKGTSNSVITFGKRMEIDHAKAGDALKDVASRHDITLPSTPNREEQATYNRLSNLGGADFDRAYAQTMIEDHQKDIAAFKKEAATGQNPDIKNFALQTLPTLQSHLQAAQEMYRSVNAGNGDQ